MGHPYRGELANLVMKEVNGTKDSNPGKSEFVSVDWASANPAHSGSEGSSSHLEQTHTQIKQAYRVFEVLLCSCASLPPRKIKRLPISKCI